MASDSFESLRRDFFKAVENNDLNKVEELLNNPKLNIDWPDPRDGCTALHRACEHGFTDVAEVLLDHGARHDLTGNSGTNPVYIAAAHGRVEIIRLFKQRINMTEEKFVREIDRRSPLNAAAHIGLVEVLQAILLELEPADVSEAMVPDCNDWTPIHIVCQRGYIYCLKVLLKAGTDPNQSSKLKKFVDCRRLVTLLNGNDAPSTDTPSWSPLHVAAHYGQTSSIRMLIKYGCDFRNKESATDALQAAALTGRSETVGFLLGEILQHGTDLPRIIAPAVVASCCLGHADVFLQCLAATSDLNSMLSQRSVQHVLSRHEDDLNTISQLVQERQDRDTQAPIKSVLRNSVLWLTANRNLHLLFCVRLFQCFLGNFEGVLNSMWRLHRMSLRRARRELSAKLHEKMCDAGFHWQRAAYQAALADELESLMQNRLSNPDQQKACVVGSFSDGWGGSFRCLNGNIEPDSDIDFTTLRSSTIFHLEGFCKCSDEERLLGKVTKYEKGHVGVIGFPGNPSLPYASSSLRPAVDRVDAFQCCCYPPLRCFEPGHKSHLPKEVLQAFLDPESLLTCHLVPGVQPDTTPDSKQPDSAPDSKQPDKTPVLRLSTTFLERLLLRKLTTVQGQVYVILKYLLKRVLDPKVKGLKSYHIKTIMFYMLDETPPQEWSSDNLVELVQNGLQRLLDWLNNSSGNDCMPHFFLSDATVYLKRNTTGIERTWNEEKRNKIKEQVWKLMQSLDTTLLEFMSGLQPCDDYMRFHPLLLHPALGSIDLPSDNSHRFEVHEVYDAVAMLLKMLSDKDRSFEDLMQRVRCLPDGARTTRHCLTVLTYMKFGKTDEAKAAVRESQNWSVSKGVYCPRDAPVSVESIKQFVQSNDWLYKFGFRLDQRPKLSFLPDPICGWFPCGISFYMHQYYVNFHALLRCLTLLLLDDDMNTKIAAEWFLEVTDSPEPDAQELLMVLKFCTDQQLLVRLIHQHRQVICELYETLSAVVELLEQKPDLQHLCISGTLSSVINKLRSTT